MTEFGSIREALADLGWDLNDAQIAANYLELAEVAESRKACAACAGREACVARVPGMVPVPKLEPGSSVRLAYERCQMDEAYSRQLRINRLLASSRLPALLRTKTFERFVVDVSNRSAYQAALSVAKRETDRGLLLAGPTGTGKSHLAAAIVNHRLARCEEAVFCTVPELLADIRGVIKSEQDTSELMEIVKNADLLVLDDLGAEKTTEWVTEQLFILVNARLLGMKETIITTNFTEATELIEKLGGLAGERIVSRLVEMCDWVRLAGPDWRLNKTTRREVDAR